ncbi:MAG: oligosaccharide flippase family protein [Candidatus Muirbacterium halophilum]|nr:oligosaccharide flippase family protein [Candidatus Muirbacterium halophilum]MCK9474947.1 oligosaccharide flippase family protein [Candidatus Muirbacterium halophilum]
MNLNIKNNLNYIFKNFSVLFLFNSLSLIISFLFNIILLSLIEQNVYGQYKYYLSIFAMLSIFSFSGFNEAYLRDVSKKNEGTLYIILKFKLKVSIIFLLLFLIASLILFYINYNILYFTLIVCVFYIPYYVFDVFKSYYSGKQKFRKIALINFVKNILIFLVIYVFLKYVEVKNGITLILLYLLISSIINSYFLFKIKKEISKSKDIKRNNDSLEFGKKISYLNFFVLLLGNTDNLLLKYFYDYKTIAIYSTAMVFMLFIKSAESSFISILTPIFYKYSNLTETFRKNYKKFLIIFFFSTILAIISYFLFPIVSRIILPEKYFESIKYANIMIFYVLMFGTMNLMFQNLLIVNKKLKKSFYLNLIVSIIRALLMIILCKYYGIYGLVYSTCFCYVLGLIFAFIFINDEIKKDVMI